jgi:molecular chaperone GrpE
VADDHQIATAAEPGAVTVEADADTDTDTEADTERVLEEGEAQLRRTLADLDNLRKRYQREVARERVDERARVAREWLAVVDNLERALQHAGDPDSALAAGVAAVLEQARTLLAQLGFPRYEDIGREFDPVRHEAIATVPADAPPGTVVAALRAGYGNGEQILRPAAVMVATHGPNSG